MSRSELDSQVDETKLVRFLREHVGETFSAAELRQHTGVPKRFTRQLLEGVHGIEVTANPLRFTAKPV